MRLAAVQALVVVDMQEDFFNDSELHRCRADLGDGVQPADRTRAGRRDTGVPGAHHAFR